MYRVSSRAGPGNAVVWVICRLGEPRGVLYLLTIELRVEGGGDRLREGVLVVWREQLGVMHGRVDGVVVLRSDVEPRRCSRRGRGFNVQQGRGEVDDGHSTLLPTTALLRVMLALVYGGLGGEVAYSRIRGARCGRTHVRLRVVARPWSRRTHGGSNFLTSPWEGDDRYRVRGEMDVETDGSPTDRRTSTSRWLRKQTDSTCLPCCGSSEGSA